MRRGLPYRRANRPGDRLRPRRGWGLGDGLNVNALEMAAAGLPGGMHGRERQGPFRDLLGQREPAAPAQLGDGIGAEKVRMGYGVPESPDFAQRGELHGRKGKIAGYFFLRSSYRACSSRAAAMKAGRAFWDASRARITRRAMVPFVTRAKPARSNAVPISLIRRLSCG